MNDFVDQSTDQSNPLPRRRSLQRQISSIQIMLAAVLSIGLLLVINFSGRIARGQQMDIERKRLLGTINVLQTQEVDLRRERDYAQSDASIEHWAYTEGKMVRDQEILVIPVPAAITVATFGDEGDRLLLREYSVQSTPGERVTITLWWSTEQVLEKDYRAAIYFLLSDGDSLVVQHQREGLPMSDTTPTTTWRPGEINEVTIQIPLPATLNPGTTYRLGLRVYAPDSDSGPLPITMSDQALYSEYAWLGTVRIPEDEPEEEPPNWHLWWNLFFDSEPPF